MAQTGRLVQRTRRVDVRVQARISTLDPVRDALTGERYFRISEETCANLSQGGAFVATHQPIEPGCRVMVELELPDGPTVQTVGRVVWSRTELATPGAAPREAAASGIGIAFTGAAPQHVDQLERFLAKRLPRRSSTRNGPMPAQPGTSL